jgi:hypothetical protein
LIPAHGWLRVRLIANGVIEQDLGPGEAGVVERIPFQVNLNGGL